MSICLRRRDFIAGLGGAVTAWPLVARAQQGDRVRRIGVLIAGSENEPMAKTYVSAFTQALADLGWAVGRNVRIDVRWAAVTPDGSGGFLSGLVPMR
jgi:putative ABC transport system substrate-binding protein